MWFDRWLQVVGLKEGPEIKDLTIKDEISLVKRLRAKARKAFGGG